MRIVSGNNTTYLYFVAVDATDLKTFETGLATWTVYRSRNGAAEAAWTTPTINEIDAANCPGLYALLIDEDVTLDSGFDSQEVALRITHAGMAPVTRTYELYRAKATAGETLTVSSGALPWPAAWDAEVQSEVDDALVARKLSMLFNAAANLGSDLTAGSFFDQLIDDGTATYDRTTDSLQAIRDRGDAAWSSSSSITELMTFIPSIPGLVDLANTATYRLSILVLNSADNLPTTAEIAAGTISIDRKARGATSWSAVVTDAACSEQSGAVYYDEVFDAGSSYAEGDHLRFTFKSISVTEGGNTFELCDANGIMFYSSIVKTVNVPTAGENADAVWDEARSGHTTTGTFGEGTLVESLNTSARNQVNAEVDTALDTAIPGSPTANSINERIATLDDYDVPTKLGTPAGASIAVDIAAVNTIAAGIQTDLSNGTDGLTALKAAIDTVDTVVDGIQTDLSNGTDGLTALKAAIDTVDTVVDGIQTDLSNGTDGLTALKAAIDTVDTVADAIKVKTDQLAFTAANVVDANVRRVNSVVIIGDGNATPFDVA